MKPHISEITKVEVKNAAEKKLAILNSWLAKDSQIPWLVTDMGEFIRDKHGELELDYFPNNVESFCAWNGAQNCLFVQNQLNGIKLTNRSTIYESHREMLLQIKTVCKALKAKATAQLTRANKSNKLEALESQIKYLEELVLKQETEIVHLRDQSLKTEIQLANKERKIRNMASNNEERLEDLKGTIANLTSLLNKVTPLKGPKI